MPPKKLKGTCQQVIDGDNAFKLLYDVVAGENGMERVLKPMFHGKQATLAFVVGVDVNVEICLFTAWESPTQGKQFGRWQIRCNGQ